MSQANMEADLILLQDPSKYCDFILIDGNATQGRLYDGKTDIWAIGCILYEMCSLKKAFDAGNLGAITVKVMRWDVISPEGPLISQKRSLLAE